MSIDFLNFFSGEESYILPKINIRSDKVDFWYFFHEKNKTFIIHEIYF